jgi:hypothetical protein
MKYLLIKELNRFIKIKKILPILTLIKKYFFHKKKIKG